MGARLSEVLSLTPISSDLAASAQIRATYRMSDRLFMFADQGDAPLMAVCVLPC
jgi:hypothetical protein